MGGHATKARRVNAARADVIDVELDAGPRNKKPAAKRVLFDAGWQQISLREPGSLRYVL